MYEYTNYITWKQFYRDEDILLESNHLSKNIAEANTKKLPNVHVNFPACIKFCIGKVFLRVKNHWN